MNRPQASRTQPRMRMLRVPRIAQPHLGHFFALPSIVIPQSGDRQALWSAIGNSPRPGTLHPPVAEIPDFAAFAVRLGLVARLGPAAGAGEEVRRALGEPVEIAAA